MKLNKKQKKKIVTIFFMSILLGIGLTCILYSLKENINLYVTPSEAIKLNESKQLLIGGMVKNNSFHKKGDVVFFTITDEKTNIDVIYKGILPNLFKENTLVIVKGFFKNKQFIAQSVLAKHDERYMPEIKL